jgi:hypothetical protein
MFILPTTLIVFLWKILNTVEDIKETIELQKETRKVRTHKAIEKSNFDNAFGGRKAYEIYKNTNGLYEPVTPSKGIKIEKKEE